ncbi:hypothetical protein [Natrinema versiforme]|uniref:Uncharacterized protein n=1 Tax=Natrinema versiforme JCM 10478 TaxID=1227496 RepID=L9Y1E0_9EURY|nr:hypothetical protein [Natrinema versiforme]ELY67507.1 hypothetical protein C489_10464 [Natrinema versiforme JCM 10478]
MKQCPRRTLLGGIGTTITAAMAGSAVGATTVQSGSDADSPAVDNLLDYLPASVASDSMMVTATDYERRREANEPYEPTPATGRFQIDPESVSKQALVYDTGDDGFSMPITVLAGEFDLEGEAESRETDGGVEYDYHENEDTVAAATETLAVIADADDTVDDAFAAKAGETERLLAAEPVLEDGFELFDGGRAGYTVQTADNSQLPDSMGDVTVEYIARAMTVLGPDTLEMNIGVELEDASAVTDELIETLKGDLAYTATTGEPTVETDGALVTISVERDLAAERAVREHDSPGFLQAERDFDLEDDYLEIEVGRGDPTPIEDLTLEVGGEEYDRDIWADGHGTLEEGDTIVIDTDDVEPNLSVTLKHDHQLGGSSSGTTILSRFEFAFDYDIDTETLAVEYEDEFPLDGDKVSLVAYDERPRYRPRESEDTIEPKATTQPWSGTMSTGDEATLEDVQPGDTVLVCWEGTGQQDSIARSRIRPPGHVRFEYDYENETLSATIEFEDETERSAAEYELLIDDEPAATQWADEYDTVSSGTTIELEDVAVGTDATAVWGDEDIRIGGTRAQPSIQLAFDEETVTHEGGDALPASKLEARVWTTDGRTKIDIADEVDGDFEEGDSFTVDTEEARSIMLRYDGEHSVGYAHPPR